MTIQISEQIACVRREIAVMEAVLATLEKLSERERLI